LLGVSLFKWLVSKKKGGQEGERPEIYRKEREELIES
jgi:hypothetical protein